MKLLSLLVITVISFCCGTNFVHSALSPQQKLQKFNPRDLAPFYILNETLYSGFGAEFSTVLGALDLYENELCMGLKVDLTSGLFFDAAVGPNWWEYYFEPINLGWENYPIKHSFLIHECCVLSQKAYNQLSRQRNFELIQKYIKVKPEIMAEADEFFNENFAGHYVIGVHHRGTDKSTEVSLVPYEITYMNLLSEIEKLPPTQLDRLRIYVATDDQHFLDYLLQFFPDRIIYSPFARSVDGSPLHYYQSTYFSSNFHKGREALVDILLLSKCDILIRPAPSGLSWVSTVFNPYMHVINLVY